MLFITYLTCLVTLNQVVSGLPGPEGPYNREMVILSTINLRALGWTTSVTFGRWKADLKLDTRSSDMVVTTNVAKIYHETKGECGKFSGNPTGPAPAENYRIPNRSGSYAKNSATLCYRDGTAVKFKIYSGVVTLGGFRMQAQYFGAASAISERLYKANSRGVLGLSYSTNSVIHKKIGVQGTTFMDSLVRVHGMIDEFGLCFDTDGISGKLILGAGYLKGMTYTAVRPTVGSTYKDYLVDVWAWMGTTQLGDTVCDQAPALLDINARSMFFPNSWMKNFITAICPYLVSLGQPCNQPKGSFDYTKSPLQITVTPEELETLPIISFKFENDGPLIHIPASSYYGQSSNDNKDIYTVKIKTPYKAFYEDSESNISDKTLVLGMPFSKGTAMHFNRAGNTIGIMSNTGIC